MVVKLLVPLRDKGKVFPVGTFVTIEPRIGHRWIQRNLAEKFFLPEAVAVENKLDNGKGIIS